MVAVVDAPHLGLALGEVSFLPCAAHVVQPDGASSPPKPSRAGGREGHPAAQLPADHRRISQVPAVIADRPPLVVIKHLDPPGTLTQTTHQAKPGDAGNPRA